MVRVYVEKRKNKGNGAVCTITKKWGSFLTDGDQLPQPWTQEEKHDDVIIKEN